MQLQRLPANASDKRVLTPSPGNERFQSAHYRASVGVTYGCIGQQGSVIGTQ